MKRNLSTVSILGAQLRAARGLAGWSSRELAERTGVSIPTIQRIESGKGSQNIQPRTIEDLISAFINEGIEFIGTPENGAGVRFKPK